VAGPTRVLIADDSEDIRGAVRVLLQAQTDIAVSGEAGNYAELLKKFNATTTDVVLMDMLIPGEQLFTPATIKGHFYGSSLLAMAVSNDERTASLARSYGAIKLLEKSSLTSTLLPAIQECMGRKQNS